MNITKEEMESILDMYHTARCEGTDTELQAVLIKRIKRELEESS